MLIRQEARHDVESDDPTTWYKESGLIAQGSFLRFP